MNNEKSITPNAHADFTPTLGNYKELQPFRYWCHKVLPLVYDDSLSYYELLCKVVDYLNKAMEDVETLHGDVTDLHTAYTELQSYVNNYFSTLDVQEEINNKLDNMAESGELYEIIRRYTDPIVNEQNDKINVLKARMDTFASLPAGSTSGDAELIDIRIGYNGTTYPSAGDAVREQIGGLKSDLENYSNNIYDIENGSIFKNIVNGTLSDGKFYDRNYEGTQIAIENYITLPFDIRFNIKNGYQLTLQRIASSGSYVDEFGNNTVYNPYSISGFTITKNIPFRFCVSSIGTEQTFAKLVGAISIINLENYITPQMFGAIGDGVHDDTEALKKAISYGKIVYIPSGTYLLNDKIVIDKEITIIGNKRAETNLLFNSDNETNVGIIIGGRYVTIKNISISGNMIGDGIKFESESTSVYQPNIENCIISNFNNGINGKTIFWNGLFENIRFNHCDTGIRVETEDNSVSIVNTFINLHFNHCAAFNLYLTNARNFSFIGCNFGIDNRTQIYYNNANVTFESCNFECDKKLEIDCIRFGSGSSEYKNCTFYVDAYSFICMFKKIASYDSISFTGCKYLTKPTNSSDRFIQADISTYKYGAFKIGNGCRSFPNLYNLTDNDRPFLSYENSPILFVNDNVTIDRLDNGKLYYYDSKLCIFTNGHLINIVDGSVVL